MSFARYRIENIIGQGGMGTIYRAYDRLTDTWVALKQLSLELADEPTPPPQPAAVRLALAEEFRLLATLRHPHIVSVLDYGFGPEAAFFTMEFLTEAQPLVPAARAQPLAGQLLLLGQLLQALEYVRRHQVIHRDLKPDNVLVQHGQVKVLDFGLAVLEGQHNPTMGSLFYMAPEAFTDQPLTHATDLFAVGVMAYEILAGQRPFVANSLNKLVAQICTAEPDYTQLGGPIALRSVVARLLAKDPAARFANATEALLALAAVGEVALAVETPATRASFIQAAQFVGRAAELAQLTTALTQAQMGQGSVWLVGGESGVGKSRLLDELRIQALVQRAWVWQGQAVSEGEQSAQLWQSILRWLVLVGTPDDLEAAVLQPFVPGLSELIERPIPAAPTLEAAAAQARFCATVLALLRRARAYQPILLILEDLQWVDPLSHAVLAWIMRAVAELGVLIVGTYRNDEQPNLPTQLPLAQQLALPRLSREQVAALTHAIFGQPTAQLAHVTTFLYQQTEGNAFFVVEVLRSLAEETGLLSRVQGMTLPKHLLVGGMQQVVHRRLQRIAANDYPWLELAAVAGHQLDLPLLQQLDSSFDWAAWLSRGAEAAVLEPQGAAWRFAHDQLRQGVLAALPTARQHALHLTIAVGLEQAYGLDLTPHLSRLVYHYMHTDQVPKQRQYLWLAGQAAQGQHDYARALEAYERLLPLVSAATEQVDLQLCLGTTLEVLGRWAEASLAYQTALAQATTEHLGLAVAHSQKALGKLARMRGNYAAAFSWLAQAQQGVEAHADLRALAQIQVETGAVYFYCSDFPQAQMHLTAGLNLARAQNDPATAALALNLLGHVQSYQGDYTAAQTLYQASLEVRRELNDKRGIADTLNNLGIVHSRRGEFGPSQALHEESLALRRELGDKRGIADSLNNLGVLSSRCGNFPSAQTFFAECLLLRRALGDVYGIASALSNLGDVASLRGDYPTALAFHTESLALRRELGSKSGLADSLVNLGLVTYLLGHDYPTALRFYTESLALGQEIGEKQVILHSLVGVAAAYAALGQVAQAVHVAAAATHLGQALQQVLGQSEQRLYAAALAAGHVVLPEAEFERAWAAGLALTLDEVIAQVLVAP